jgi:hypothetical protein
MSKPLDRDGIAAAMRDAALKAVHGTREERSGVFNPTPVTKAAAPKPVKSKAAV